MFILPTSFQIKNVEMNGSFLPHLSGDQPPTYLQVGTYRRFKGKNKSKPRIWFFLSLTAVGKCTPSGHIRGKGYE